MDTTQQQPELLTLTELAALLRIGQRTAYRLARDGEVPATKVGGQWRIPRAELERHLAGRRESAP